MPWRRTPRALIQATSLAVLVVACSPAALVGPTGTAPSTGPSVEVPGSSSPGASVASGGTGSVAAIGSLLVPRAVHTATLLDDGRVLLAGGCARDGCGGNRDAMAAELFDPATVTFQSGPSMAAPRAGHTATLLMDGRVLVVGGYAGEGQAPLSSAEVFDPTSGSFRPVGDLAGPRGSHTATRLADGRVLIVGGDRGGERYLDSVEIFDPTTDRFAAVASLPTARATHGATLLPDGRVLIAGGEIATEGGGTSIVATTLIYDPATDEWTESGDLVEARYKHAVVTLPDGRALAIGGSGAGDFEQRLATIEVWDPATGAWEPLAEMARARFKIPDAAVVLADGRILVAGDGTMPEVLDPATGSIGQVAGALTAAGLFATATALADGRVLIAGGYDERIRVLDQAYLFTP